MRKNDAVKHFKTKANLVRALQSSKTPRSKAAVSMWGDLVPLPVAHELSRITRGKLKVDLPAYQKAYPSGSSAVA
jgi:hypothetical protein